MILTSGVAPSLEPDRSKVSHILGCEYRGLKETVMKIVQLLRIGVLTDGCGLIVGLEGLVDVRFLASEIE